MDEEITKTGVEKRAGEGSWISRKGWMGILVHIGGIEVSGL
jgi:hypothetical protein